MLIEPQLFRCRLIAKRDEKQANQFAQFNIQKRFCGKNIKVNQLFNLYRRVEHQKMHKKNEFDFNV